MDLLSTLDQLRNYEKNKEIKEEKEEEIIESEEEAKPIKKVKKSDIKNMVTTYENYLKFMKKKKISISTITLNCKLHTKVKLKRFAKEVVKTLNINDIAECHFGDPNDKTTNGTVISEALLKKMKKKRVSKRKVNFYNQATILMRPSNPDRKTSFMNLKVFKNGSLQVTGCREISDFKEVAEKLISKLKNGINGKMFVNDGTDLQIYDLKINMINSNFKIGMKICREKLYALLKKFHEKDTRDTEIGHVKVTYNPSGGHSCVNITHFYQEGDNHVKIHIYVFQTGSVIITGAKNYQQIVSAYFYLKKIIKKYQEQIQIVEFKYSQIKKTIEKFYRMKEREKKKEKEKAIE